MRGSESTKGLDFDLKCITNTDMIDPKYIEDRLVATWPGTEVIVRDLTGTLDHFQVVVISPAFEGRSMIQQHRLVNGIFEADIASGELHALTIKTFTPNEWAKENNRNGSNS